MTRDFIVVVVEAKPDYKEDITHLPPEQLVEGILEKEQRIAGIMVENKKLLAKNKRAA